MTVKNEFMINLYESMGPARDRARHPRFQIRATQAY